VVEEYGAVPGQGTDEDGEKQIEDALFNAKAPESGADFTTGVGEPHGISDLRFRGSDAEKECASP
jgi:hypothetical protein